VFFRDIDASAVIPSRGNQPYSTRIVDPNGNPLSQFYGIDLGSGIVLGSGNPGDEGKQLGVSLTVKAAGKGNKYATVYVTPPQP
jgi:immune inhibitor A